MLLSFSSVVISLLLAPAVQAGPVVSRQATAPFDCGQVRVDSPNTTYSGFLAAELDTERRYVVTRTANQKRLLTRFENNTLFTLVSRPFRLTWRRRPHQLYRIVMGRTQLSEQPLDSTGIHHRASRTSRLRRRTMHTSTALLPRSLATSLPKSRLRSTRLGPILPQEGRETTRANRQYSIWTLQVER